MNKREFFLRACEAGAYKKTSWNTSIFSMVFEGPDDWKSDPFPYRLVQLPHGHHYVDPDNTDQLIRIEDTPVGKPLFRALEAIGLEPNDIPNVRKPIVTTYGNCLANYLMLVYAFGDKIPFQTGRISIKKIEAIIEQRLVDSNTPENVDTSSGFVSVDGDTTLATIARDPDNEPIYIDEYLRYCNGAFSTVAYTQVFTPAATKKTMTAPPGIIELRDKLVAENKDRLHDRAVVAGIVAKLQEADAEYLKGDRGLGFLVSDKSRKIVRSKMFLAYGAETGIEEKIDVDFVQRSLTEGWDIDKFASMNNSLRAGSYNRGKQTELGGEAVKDILRATSNMRISGEDCGSTIGVGDQYIAKNIDRLIGFTVIDGDAQTKVTRANAGEYIGKRIVRRTPLTCKMEKTDFCSVCLGDRLSNSPTGLSMAIADLGSAFLGIFMSAAHSKGIKATRLNIFPQLR